MAMQSRSRQGFCNHAFLQIDVESKRGIRPDSGRCFSVQFQTLNRRFRQQFYPASPERKQLILRCWYAKTIWEYKGKELHS